MLKWSPKQLSTWNEHSKVGTTAGATSFGRTACSWALKSAMMHRTGSPLSFSLETFKAKRKSISTVWLTQLFCFQTRNSIKMGLSWMCMFSVPCLAFSADPAMLSWRTGQEELSKKAMQAFSITTYHLLLPDLCRIAAETQLFPELSIPRAKLHQHHQWKCPWSHLCHLTEQLEMA